MHEFALIEGVLGLVRDSALQNNIRRVERIKLVVGKLSMALPDSLQFAFEAFKADEELFHHAVLEIEEKEIICSCGQCNQSFTVEDSVSFICPWCGSVRVEIIQGRELYIDCYEGEEC